MHQYHAVQPQNFNKASHDFSPTPPKLQITEFKARSGAQLPPQPQKYFKKTATPNLQGLLMKAFSPKHLGLKRLGWQAAYKGILTNQTPALFPAQSWGIE